MALLTGQAEIEQAGSRVDVGLEVGQIRREQIQPIVGECLERMRYSGAREFVIDLDGVEFISSGAVGSLVELLHELKPVRGRIALTHCNDQITSLFRVTQLDQIFEVEEE